MSSTMRILVVLFVFCVIVKAEEEKVEEKTKPEEPKLHYVKPEIPEELANFAESFHSNEEFETRWVRSQAKKDGVDASIAKYDGVWEVKQPKDNPLVGDHGLFFTSEAQHGAISSMLKEPFKFEDKPFFIQYEVKFQNKHECGGAYVKLLAESPTLNVNEFTDKTQYSIMFGPDKCGGDGKLHFIFQHQNPNTHKMEEKHAKKPSGDYGHIFDDGKTHLIALVIRPDNTFEISVDKVKVNEGSLLSDMEPPVNPSREIDDPEDKKPEEWDEREKIPDPVATKPDDWDEDAPKNIPDPAATKPAGWLDDEPELTADPEAVRPVDWDEEEDGEWEAPQINNPLCKAVGCGEWKPAIIKNPNYKGKWTPALISNPDYKGIWAPKRIENPDYFEDTNPFAMKPIAAVGFELWSMQSDIMFDNIIIADDVSTINQWTAQTWDKKHSKEVADTPSAVGSMVNDFTKAANDKPWLYGVAIAAVLLPIILLYFFCFSGGNEEKVKHYKKTDAPQPDDLTAEDDEPVNEEGSASEKSGDEGAKIKEVTEKSEKAKDEESVEEKNTEEKEGEKKEEDKEEETEEKDEESAPSDESKEDAKTTVEEALQASPSPKTRSRRKTRKE